MGKLRFQLLPCFCIAVTLWHTSWGTELLGKSPIDKSHDVDNSVASKRDPISDNSTLAQALALARQFLVRDENIITSANVELFKRSDGTVVANVTDKPKLFSWWQFSKKPSAQGTVVEAATEEPEEEESEEVESESPEDPPTTMVSEISPAPSLPEEPTVGLVIVEISTSTFTSVPSNPTTTSKPDPATQPTTPMTSTSPPPPPQIPEKNPDPITPSQEPEMIPTSPTPTPKRTRKPRPTKRPKTKRTTTTPTPIEIDPATPPANSDVDLTPPGQGQEGGQGQNHPNTIKDPFGVKRKFKALVRKVGNAVFNQTRSLKEKAGPIAREGSRQLGIIALTAVGSVGNLTKNTAAHAYDDLARKLNATELVDPRRNPQNANSNTTGDTASNGQMVVMDDKEKPCNRLHIPWGGLKDIGTCSGGHRSKGQGGSSVSVLVGTVGLLLMKWVVT